MKKVLVSLALCGALSSSAFAASEQNGFILGVTAGGAAALNVLDTANAVGSTTIVAGIKGGYQAFFADRHAVRYYLSTLFAWGYYPANVTATAANQRQLLSHDLYVLADLNADYMFNWWEDGEAYNAGLFAGFFTGILSGIPMTNSNGESAVGSTFGLNLGVRTSINYHHQVEFGVKSALAFFSRPSNNNLGAVIAAQVSYLFKF